MMFTWHFMRSSAIPIIEVKGESEIKESEQLLLENVIEIIEIAERFKGRPYHNTPGFPTTKGVSVCFSLIFLSEKDIVTFMEFINNL